MDAYTKAMEDGIGGTVEGSCGWRASGGIYLTFIEK